MTITMFIVVFISGKMCIGYIRCLVAYSPRGFDAVCSVRPTAAAASEGQGVDTNEGASGAQPGSGARRKTQAIAVWVTPEQRAEIERLAAATGLSLSVYLRTLGLAYEPKSILDAERVGELLKVCGDLGRLGGLLKLWLVDKPGQGAPETDVRRLLEQIQEVREAIVTKVAAV